MSHVPEATAFIPEPEPVGLYVTDIPVSFSKVSPRTPITFSIDVEPSVDTDDFEAPHPDIEAQITSDAAIKASIFFIVKFPFRFVFAFYIAS